MSEITKKQRKHLLELSDRCYELEMTDALDDLHKNFIEWKNNEISVWELNEKIHHHHNVTARNLNKFYVQLRDPRVAVAQALSKGIIKLEDVQENCKPVLQNLIEFYNEQ